MTYLPIKLSILNRALRKVGLYLLSLILLFSIVGTTTFSYAQTDTSTTANSTLDATIDSGINPSNVDTATSPSSEPIITVDAIPEPAIVINTDPVQAVSPKVQNTTVISVDNIDDVNTKFTDKNSEVFVEITTEDPLPAIDDLSIVVTEIDGETTGDLIIKDTKENTASDSQLESDQLNENKEDVITVDSEDNSKYNETDKKENTAETNHEGNDADNWNVSTTPINTPIPTTILKKTITAGELAKIKLAITSHPQANISVDEAAGIVQEPNYIYHTTQVNNSQIADWWYGEDPTVLHQRVAEVHATTPFRGAGVTVAVIDTGINLDHTDLVGSEWSNSKEIPNNNIDDDNNGYIDDINGWNFFDANNDLTDDLGHGTSMAGLIAAQDNTIGVIGVAPAVKLMPLKVCDLTGNCPLENILSALDYAEQNQADVILLALGSTDYSYILEQKINAVLSSGSLIVASSGNDASTNLNYPAGYSGVVSVGASTPTGDVAWFSDTGAGLDFVSPGVAIRSTIALASYSTANGTSYSAATVAGLLALAKERFSGNTNTAIINAARQTAKDLITAGYDTQSGYGLLDPVALLALDPQVLDHLPLARGQGDYSVTAPAAISTPATPPVFNPSNLQSDFFVQHISADIADNETERILTAPSDFIAPANANNAWVFISNPAHTGAGRSNDDGKQNAKDVTAYISAGFETDLNQIIVSRFSDKDDTQVNLTIVEYIGSTGGGNEIQVRRAGSAAYDPTATTTDIVGITGIADIADTVVWITGQANPDKKRKNYNTGLSTAELLDNTTARLTRSEAGNDAVATSYAIVEFTGTNWKIQRSEHTYTATGAAETETITAVNDLTRAFLHTQKRSGMPDLADFGHTVYLSTADTITYQLRDTADITGQTSVAWVIENTQLGGDPLIVTRGAGTRLHGGDEPDIWDVITGVSYSPAVSLLSINNDSSGTNTKYPRAILGALLNSATSFQLWRSDTGASQDYRWEHIRLPTAPPPGALTVNSTGNQISELIINTANNYIGGAFTFINSSNQIITQIKLNETGTVNANTNLTNAKLYTETSATCTYNGDETLFGTASNFDTAEQITFTGSLPISSSQVCAYVVLDVGTAVHNETIKLEISNPTTDITVNTGSVAPVIPVALAGMTRIIDGSTSSAFRVTEYYIPSNTFTGTNYELTLDQDLAAQHLVLIRGSASGNVTRGADTSYARVVGLPAGINRNLGISTGPNKIELQRFTATGSWSGVVTVIESLADNSSSGFQVRDILEVTTNNTDTIGTATSGTAWSNINQVALFGGAFGAGSEVQFVDTQARKYTSGWSRWYPTGANTINWERFDGGGRGLATATHTVYVIEWGTQWNIQHTAVTKTTGGNGANQVAQYTTGAIAPVTRANTWVWGTGYSTDDGIGDGAEGILVTLGDGVNQNTTENTVALGGEYADSATFDIYTFTHPDLAVDYRFKPDGDSSLTQVDVATDPATMGYRFSWATNGQNGTGNAYTRPIFNARYTTDTNISLERGRRGQAFPAWIQGIDFVGIVFTNTPVLTIDIVDNLGASVLHPSITLSSVIFAFISQSSTGILGVPLEKIRLSNQTTNPAWSVSIAATGGVGALWNDGNGQTMNYNDPGIGGQLGIDPSIATITRTDGGSTAGISLGSPAAFEAGIVDNITLFTSSSAAINQSYDLTGAELLQIVPNQQPAGTYTLDLTLTAI